MWKKQMRVHPKIFNQKFLYVYTVSKGDTLLKNASSKGNLNRNCKSLEHQLIQKDPRRFGYLKQKWLLVQVCLKSIHLKEKKWHLDSRCSGHMIGNKSWFRNLRPKDGGMVKFADIIKARIIGIGNVSKND